MAFELLPGGLFLLDDSGNLVPFCGVGFESDNCCARRVTEQVIPAVLLLVSFLHRLIEIEAVSESSANVVREIAAVGLFERTNPIVHLAV